MWRSQCICGEKICKDFFLFLQLKLFLQSSLGFSQMVGLDVLQGRIERAVVVVVVVVVGGGDGAGAGAEKDGAGGDGGGGGGDSGIGGDDGCGGVGE